MTTARFDYEHNRWAGGDTVLAKRWYDEFKRCGPEHVRRQLDSQLGNVGRASGVIIGEMLM